MGRLRDAYDKQRKYAKNEYLSGDEAKGDEHAAKAEAFLDRLIAGEDAALGGPDTADADQPTTTEDEPLSDDMAEAQAQLLERIGVEPGADWATVKAAATDEQARELAFLGVAGQPGTYPDADYSLFQEYYEPSSPPDPENGMQSWAPKPEYAASGSGWKAYLAGKGV